MEKREMICIVCPIGCHLEVIEDTESETGYSLSWATCKLPMLSCKRSAWN